MADLDVLRVTYANAVRARCAGPSCTVGNLTTAARPASLTDWLLLDGEAMPTRISPQGELPKRADCLFAFAFGTLPTLDVLVVELKAQSFHAADVLAKLQQSRDDALEMLREHRLALRRMAFVVVAQRWPRPELNAIAATVLAVGAMRERVLTVGVANANVAYLLRLLGRDT